MAWADPGRQRGAEAQPHGLAVVAVPGRRDREIRVGLVSNAVLDNLAVAVEAFFLSAERNSLRHARVVGWAGPTQSGRRDRDDDLAPGVGAQAYTDIPRPALVHHVCGQVEQNRDLGEAVGSL